MYLKPAMKAFQTQLVQFQYNTEVAPRLFQVSVHNNNLFIIIIIRITQTYPVKDNINSHFSLKPNIYKSVV